MTMNTAYLDAIASAGGALITHIGLVDAGAAELSGGGYARQPVTWTAPSSGLIRPDADCVFSVAAAAVVAGWKGYSALTGGTSYDGQDLTQATFSNAGTYTLTAASTGINHSAV